MEQPSERPHCQVFNEFFFQNLPSTKLSHSCLQQYDIFKYYFTVKHVPSPKKDEKTQLRKVRRLHLWITIYDPNGGKSRLAWQWAGLVDKWSHCYKNGHGTQTTVCGQERSKCQPQQLWTAEAEQMRAASRDSCWGGRDTLNLLIFLHSVWAE